MSRSRWRSSIRAHLRNFTEVQSRRFPCLHSKEVAETSRIKAAEVEERLNSRRDKPKNLVLALSTAEVKGRPDSKQVKSKNWAPVKFKNPVQTLNSKKEVWHLSNKGAAEVWLDLKTCGN